jgi:uncharacterized repeat protein (TIGR01451 family)
MTNRRAQILVVLALLAVAAGCGGGDDGETAAVPDVSTETTATEDDGFTATGTTAPTTEPEPEPEPEPDGPGCCLGVVFLQVPDKDDPTFTIQATNASETEVTDVTLTNTLSNGVAAEANASEGTCELAGNNVSCAVGSLQPGESVTITVRLAPQAEGAVTNSVRVVGESLAGAVLRANLRRTVELPSLAPATATS